MADPSGPTVAKDRDDLSSTPSPEDPVPAGEQATGATPAAPAAVDGTGTVESAEAAPAAGTDAEPEAEAKAPDPPADPTERAAEAADTDEEGGRATVAGAEDAEAEAPEAPTDGNDAGARAADDGDGDGDDLDDDLDDDEPVERRRRGGVLTKQIQVEARHILIGAVVVALAVGAYVLGQRQGRDLVESTAPRPTATTAFVPPKDFIPFEDKESGIKLSIPKDWEARSTVSLGPTARLLRSVPGSEHAMIMRVNAYANEVTAANLNDQKSVFDAALADQNISLLVNQAAPTELGLPALIYVYQFKDEQTGVVGIHSRYVFFQGRKVVTILFQALPEDSYKELGPVWDKIIQSLEIAPGAPPPFAEQVSSTASTAPGASPAPPGAAIPGPTPTTVAPAPPATG